MPLEKKKLARLLKKPLPADVERELFEYDPCFLRNLGSMSLSTPVGVLQRWYTS